MSAATKKKTAAKRTGKSPASPRVIDLTGAREFVAVRLPGAEVNAKFGGVSFFVDGKVFAFSRPKGLVMKLPPDAMAEVLETREAAHLTMGKRVMREWALLRLESRKTYVDEVPLLKQAMAYVRSVDKKKR
jgi:hypothetical protein